MKKVILSIGLLMLLVGNARAEIINMPEILSKLPALNHGVAYSLVDSRWNYITTIDVIKKKGFALEFGYAGAAKNTGSKVVAVLSYEVLQAGTVDLPIIKNQNLKLGGYFGVGQIDIGALDNGNETDAGLTAMTTIKF